METEDFVEEVLEVAACFDFFKGDGRGGGGGRKIGEDVGAKFVEDFWVDGETGKRPAEETGCGVCISFVSVVLFCFVLFHWAVLLAVGRAYLFQRPRWRAVGCEVLRGLASVLREQRVSYTSCSPASMSSRQPRRSLSGQIARYTAASGVWLCGGRDYR